MRSWLNSTAFIQPADQRQQCERGFCGIEKWLLSFLQVFVVGEWQAFQSNDECRRVADDAADLPRTSSSRSGFFFCGMALLPVE